jgi:hypothetical protein
VQRTPRGPDVAVEQPPLPREPEDGVLITVALPSRKRITRKFDKDGTAGDVVRWVAADDEMSGARFELRLGTGLVVDAKRTLADQGIAARTLLNVVVQK